MDRPLERRRELELAQPLLCCARPLEEDEADVPAHGCRREETPFTARRGGEGEADVLAERVSGDELGEDPRPLEGGAGEEEDVVAYGGLQPRLVNLGSHVWPRAHLAWFAAARDHVEQSGQLLEIRRVEPDQVLRLDPPHRLLGPRPQPGRLEEGLAREQPARRVDEDARLQEGSRKGLGKV